ncbi:PRC-barrel domain-containing protein [Marivita sp. GX14005]|uniref:PRC-barrel domain-containing protein n=1 Tax=Marivita sp. GX14005 TaxID=2942276 RepID=UPI00201882EF|nr:PRC-barrel domain-containing protein [Marivita sp. GX14005]MCL3881982.1 PRC-barrel domain-containing protein [Marivita sp. GX14005]
MLRSTSIAALLMATPLAAQDAEVGTAGPKDTRDGTYMQSVDDVDVYNTNGEMIGEIEEILVDQDGKPAGFVIEFGGFLGLADSDVAVPLDALEWEGSHYVSKMTAEQLKKLRPWDE